MVTTFTEKWPRSTVPGEEVVGLGNRAADAEEPLEVQELAVQVAADCHGATHRLTVGLFLQNLAGLLLEGSLVLHQLGHNLLHLARQLADAGREVHIEARAQAKLLLDADEACLVVLEAPQALQDAVLRSRGALPPRPARPGAPDAGTGARDPRGARRRCLDQPWRSSRLSQGAGAPRIGAAPARPGAHGVR